MIQNAPRLKRLLLTGLLALSGCNTALQHPPGTPHQQATAYTLWQAESHSGQGGTQLETTTDTGGGQNVGFIGNGDHLVFNNVDFGTSNTPLIDVRLASGAAAGVSGKIEFRLGSTTGTKIAEVTVHPTGGWQTWGTFSTRASSVSGVHNLYLVFTSTSGVDIGNLNWFQITRSNVTLPTSDTPNFGSNVHIFGPSTSAGTIQSKLDEVFNAQKFNNFGTRRDAILFSPGTYNNSINVGYNTTIAGLGLNPNDVTLNGYVTVDTFTGSGNATQNFWRAAENFTIQTPSGLNRWAVSQAAPFRRMHVKTGLDLRPSMPPGYGSGGFIADTRIDGTVEAGIQQQWYTRDTRMNSWNGSNWNMVFSGVTGAPANSFPNPRITTLPTTPISREKPFLYVDGAGKYRVFLPALRQNTSSISWPNTPGSSIPLRDFYVAKPSDSTATLNQALSQGLHLFFTPGIYRLSQTLKVTRPNTVLLGIGLPTLIPDGGVNAIEVSDVDGVRLAGLMVDAGPVISQQLITVGEWGSHINHAANPTSLQDVFVRIGGYVAGKAKDSFFINSDNTLIDHIWAWRADHGNSGTVGWTVNTADTGLVVFGNNVLATGLFVEHYQKYQTYWAGQGGRTIFFQNELPYDPPNQSAWRTDDLGYAAYKVADTVTTHEAWGLGSYAFFNVFPQMHVARSFEVPNVAGVKMHSLVTVSIGNMGTIDRVINTTGAPTPTNTTPSTVTHFP
ncbi:carbohydrate-binding protein [Deinococcus cellulosilyticus]|uniref:CBM6 domain-containing protein n=1 Tax=Deinococcus cellulosilyticus (strain DSM 18568 / NBRC 106333 / KACC 11606 / 5516J-15) TaxID=1223518 RepID=A0A511N357_DEIC1|nr:carbohydrate-binding protein [Deinococcus cellulosilyticus]GEM46841.1 hypothetical protein DC3_24760 [Deinococcus cellulosilyticus NBRC 106333 = KACC 11606]